MDAMLVVEKGSLGIAVAAQHIWRNATLMSPYIWR
jgi:hypothetical protein